MRVFAKSLVLSALVLAAASSAPAQTQDNEAMAQNVAQTLKESGRLKKYHVAVQYQDGVAWLSGTVSSGEQRQTAEMLAGQTPGVTRVVNRLEIAGQQGDDVTLAQGPVDHGMPVPTQGFSPPYPENATTTLGPEPRPMAMPQPPNMVPAAGPPHAYGPMPHDAGMMGAPMGAPMGAVTGGPVPIGYSPQGMARTVSHDHPAMPGYAWPSYASYPNYAALTYPQQYSAAAWPYIGPFYPYPQVPLGWRQVTLEWDDGWWFLDFKE
jgi:hypothetical protein